MKKYFLFVSRRPFMCAWFETFIPASLCLLFVVVYRASYLNEYFLLGLLISIAIFFVLGIINYGVVNLKITKVSVKPNELALIHYPFPEKNVEIFRKSVWGKYLQTVVSFPVNWEIEVKRGDENRFSTGIAIIINSDVRLFVAVTFNFIFSGPFGAEDLRSTLLGDCILDNVDVDKFLQKTFEYHNLSGETFVKLTQDGKSYYNNSISKREFIDRLSHNIKFPKLFFNVEAIGLTIDKVKFNYSTLITNNELIIEK